MLHLANCWLTFSSHTITLFVLFNCSNFFTLPTLGLSSSPQELHVPSKNDVQTDLLSLLFAVLCERGVEADSKKLNTSSALQVSLTPFLFNFDPKNILKNKIRQSSTNTKAKLLTFFISRSYRDINFSQNIHKLGEERKEDFSFRILFGSHQISRA